MVKRIILNGDPLYHWMTDDEIVAFYKDAASPDDAVSKLGKMNLMPWDEIEKILRENGVLGEDERPPKHRTAPQKKSPEFDGQYAIRELTEEVFGDMDATHLRLEAVGCLLPPEKEQILIQRVRSGVSERNIALALGVRCDVVHENIRALGLNRGNKTMEQQTTWQQADSDMLMRLIIKAFGLPGDGDITMEQAIRLYGQATKAEKGRKNGGR